METSVLTLTVLLKPTLSPALNFLTTNVTSKLWNFKAEGSLEILQSGALICVLDNKGQTGECAPDLNSLEHKGVIKTL